MYVCVEIRRWEVKREITLENEIEGENSSNSIGPKILAVTQENNDKYFLILTNVWQGRKRL